MEDNLSVEEVTENVLKLDDALQSAIQNIKDNPKRPSGGNEGVENKCEESAEERREIGAKLSWALHHFIYHWQKCGSGRPTWDYYPQNKYGSPCPLY